MAEDEETVEAQTTQPDNSAQPPAPLSPELLHQMRKAGFSKPPGVSWGDWVGPRKLSDRHRYIAYLLATGMRQGEVAREVGMTQGRLSIVQNSKRMRAEVARLQKEIYGESAEARFSSLAAKAIKFAEEVLDNPQERSSLRYQVAKDLIDRSYGKARETLKVENNTIKELFEALDRINLAAPKNIIQVNNFVDPGPNTSTIPKQPHIEVKPDEFSDIDKWIAKNIPTKPGET